MENYGVTEKGFVIKRMDTIMEEIHEELSEGFGIDTRMLGTSYLNTLITSFSGKIADLWEVAQDSYYSKYPSTATGMNLDNAVQYGGIKRERATHSIYYLHCTGDDGTYVRDKAYVATDTRPEIRLYSSDTFKITREACNRVVIAVSAIEGAIYSITINGSQYNYMASDFETKEQIITGLLSILIVDGYDIKKKGEELHISDNDKTRNNEILLSDNLTTKSVTTIARFYTEDYGKITIPIGLVSVRINNIPGFNEVTNIIKPTYGRLEESDVELRHSFIQKSASRSNGMLDSIVSHILESIEDVESASGYENNLNVYDDRGLPPHSIEIVVEGGDTSSIAQAILDRKAGGIQTFGSIETEVPTKYGDRVMIRFNRPEYLYTWLKITVNGDGLPNNFRTLVNQAIVSHGSQYVAGDDLYIQKLLDGIYKNVTGVSFVDIKVAYTSDKNEKPNESAYKVQNVIASARQKIVIDETRVEVFHENT